MTNPLHAVYEILAKEVVYGYDDPQANLGRDPEPAHVYVHQRL